MIGSYPGECFFLVARQGAKCSKVVELPPPLLPLPICGDYINFWLNLYKSVILIIIMRNDVK